MKKKYRKESLKSYAKLAKEGNRRNDVVMQRQWSIAWRDLATQAELKRAPNYINWD